MLVRFNDDVTEADIKDLFGEYLEEGEPIIGFGCYSYADLKNIPDNVRIIIFIILAIPISFLFTYSYLIDLVNLIVDPKSSSISSLGDMGFSLIFALIPLLLIIAVIISIRSVIKAGTLRKTVTYAYTSKFILTMQNGKPTGLTPLQSDRRINVTQHGKYADVSVRYAFNITRTHVVYVKDGERFCESLSCYPETELYFNNKKYSGSDL